MATYTTKQQKAVLDCLSERADSPVSAAAIVDALREQGEHIGIATVYRQLESSNGRAASTRSRRTRARTISSAPTAAHRTAASLSASAAGASCTSTATSSRRSTSIWSMSTAFPSIPARRCSTACAASVRRAHETHCFLFLALALAFSLTACTVPVEKADDGKIQIVATLFPYYDFARAIAGDRADVTLLLSPGREAHSFEPTPLDAVTISESDVFLYNGGEGEYWVDSMLGAAGENIAVIARMMDYVDALDEEYVEGMQGADGHDHDHEHGSHDDHDDHDHDHEEDEHDSDEVEYDEHIWTSPKNAVVLCRAVCDAICKADPANEDFYRANCDGYCAQIEALDARFASLCESAPHKLLVFADRFPMLYFCREFGLDYRAAFHGCSGDTEPSLATIKYLIDKVEDEDIPVVYTIDFGTKKVAAVVSECTGAAVDTLYSMQTVSRADFDAGETYLTLMERNYEALRKGLNE
ncbi:MAG: metal ABC transporter solute-binding protein, Zn/Mn family [Oscillibacter sp.]